MPLVTLEYYPNEKNNRTSTVGINTHHIVTYEERIIFHENSTTNATKVILSNNDTYNLAYSFKEFSAILSKVTVVHNFDHEYGDYYIEIKRYPKPENPPTL